MFALGLSVGTGMLFVAILCVLWVVDMKQPSCLNSKVTSFLSRFGVSRDFSLPWEEVLLFFMCYVNDNKTRMTQLCKCMHQLAQIYKFLTSSGRRVGKENQNEVALIIYTLGTKNISKE